MEDFILRIIYWVLERYPEAMAVISVVGILRIINKPLQGFLDKVVEAIPGEKDDEFLAKMRESKIYKVFIFLLDYIGSIKPPKKLAPKEK